ncbi:MAG TPA: hypothetical protein VJ836_05535 [Candidatus Saccharimonadales bacterium]|nr:hypothetical protein [Candidatus Saccharimonadales bacterium]
MAHEVLHEIWESESPMDRLHAAIGRLTTEDRVFAIPNITQHELPDVLTHIFPRVRANIQHYGLMAVGPLMGPPRASCEARASRRQSCAITLLQKHTTRGTLWAHYSVMPNASSGKALQHTLTRRLGYDEISRLQPPDFLVDYENFITFREFPVSPPDEEVEALIGLFPSDAVPSTTPAGA